jgi:hypothetical protein
MPEESDLSRREAERAELDVVEKALQKSTRLARLAHYLGEKYFLGEIDQLHEYGIATEVFGRSKTAFDASEDAIARVEAHRLRKKLREYYEREGKDHLVHLSLPSGSYVPVFTHQSSVLPSSDPLDSPGSKSQPATALTPESASTPPAVHGSSAAWRTFLKRKGWLYALLAVVAVGAIFGFYSFSGSTKQSKATPAQPTGGGPSVSSNATGMPIRLIAGYTGQPQMDSSGAIWTADRYDYGGGTWTRSTHSIARTSDPLLFERWRTGDFFYNIPLPPGVYELHLYFVTMDNGSDDARTFSVSINNKLSLPAFDVNSDALGENIADERIFRDVSPDKDGYLRISFTGERGTPALNAIEILPGIPHKQLPIRLVMQPTSVTDHDGQTWHPDNYFMNGRLSTQREPIQGSPDPDLFAAERYGHFTYALPVDTRGRYTLVLHFAEFYFGPHASGQGGTGNRIFRVMCNGVMLLDNFDIYKEAGSLHALTKTFYHLKPTAQGKLNLTFEPIVNNATVSGIEVLDESN